MGTTLLLISKIPASFIFSRCISLRIEMPASIDNPLRLIHGFFTVYISPYLLDRRAGRRVLYHFSGLTAAPLAPPTCRRLPPDLTLFPAAIGMQSP